MNESDAMTPEVSPAPTPAAPARPAAASEDLSAEIARVVEKWPGDNVRCTRVTGNRYRCNWWAAENTGTYDNPGMAGLLVTTHRVRKSSFLTVTRGAAGLVITEPDEKRAAST